MFPFLFFACTSKLKTLYVVMSLTLNETQAKAEVVLSTKVDVDHDPQCSGFYMGLTSGYILRLIS